MEISLIRHGKSKHIENNRITCTEFQDWIKKYDGSGVYEEINYPIETFEKMKRANIVITSHLKRSTDSASLLNQCNEVISDVIFRETELPTFPKILGLKFSPNIWAVILRCIWLIGYSRQCESLANAKQRAKQASEQLVKYAEKHRSVVLVGHGFFNQLISTELRRIGWKGKRKTSSKYWNCTTYSL